MTTGTVKWFNLQKGFGFIAPDDGGNDAFVHVSAVERAGMGDLREGQKVGFELVSDPKNGKMSAEQSQGSGLIAAPVAVAFHERAGGAVLPHRASNDRPQRRATAGFAGPPWRERDPVRRLAFIGNSLPRRCGIATFTTDLQQAIATSCPGVETCIVAMTDHGQPTTIHPSFAFRSDDDRIEDYVHAADFLNAGQFDVVFPPA